MDGGSAEIKDGRENWKRDRMAKFVLNEVRHIRKIHTDFKVSEGGVHVQRWGKKDASG